MEEAEVVVKVIVVLANRARMVSVAVVFGFVCFLDGPPASNQS